MKKHFTPQEVARLVGIPGGRVRYWTRLGLVPHVRQPRRRLWFDFQGLVALRTIKELRDQGVSLHKIRACVEKLKKRHPEITEPLSQVRFFATRRKIVLAQKRRRFTPEGQLHLDFTQGSSRIVPLAEPDPGGVIGQLYDVYDEEAGVDLRGRFLIDPDGNVQALEVLAPAIGRNVAEMIRQVKACAHVRDTGEATPAGWEPGKKTLKPEAGLAGKVCEIWAPDMAF